MSPGVRRLRAPALGLAAAGLLAAFLLGRSGIRHALPEQAGEGAAPSHGVPATVERVIDGDTIVVRLNGALERVRYLGIDAPELQPAAQCHAEEAAEANRRMLAGGLVRLTFDRERRDEYGRLLAYVWAAPDGGPPVLV